MKIKNIKINGYGNLENKSISFGRGINVIQGSNESGKSTLLNYIISTFYGISTKKDGKDFSDYEIYKPWNTDQFSGKIEYELDNGESFEVYRNFKKKNAQIYNSKKEDISSTFDIDKKDGNLFILQQTNVDKKMYLSTVVSMQQDVRLDTKTENILIQKIANLAGTGDDNISYKKAVDKLQDKIKNEIGTNRTSQKPINIIENEIQNINKKLEEIKPFEHDKYEIDQEKDRILKEINELKQEKQFASKIKSAIDKKKETKQKLLINTNNKDENLINLGKLNIENQTYEDEKKKIEKDLADKLQEKTELETKANTIKEQILKKTNNKTNNKNKKNSILIILLILSAIALITNILIIKNSILMVALIITIIIETVLSLKNNNNQNHKKEKNNELDALNSNLSDYEVKITNIKSYIETIYEKQKENIRKQSMIQGKINLLKENNSKLQQENSSIENTIEKEVNQEIDKICEQYKELIKDDYISKIKNTNDIQNEIENINNELNDKELEFNKLEIRENNVIPQLDRMVELEEKKEAYKEEYNSLIKQKEIISIAIENLDKAYEEMKTTITPKFTKNLSNNIMKISNGKYTNATVNDEKGMIIETSKGDYITAEKLSVGTIDQLYLSLRLSMIEELSEENLPIMLDETFAYFDNKRLENVIKYLSEELIEHQVLLYTCTNREKEILDKLKIKYNLIQMN